MAKLLVVGCAAASVIGSLALSAPASAVSTSAATKELRFRGMTLTIPSNWKVTYAGRTSGGKDWVTVYTRGCSRLDDKCPHFDLVGPKVLKPSVNMFLEGFDPKYPWAPGTGVVPCRFKPGTNHSEVFPRRKPLVADVRAVGAGHKAQYREWRGECRTQGGKLMMDFTQRQWYLPKSGILIVDAWKNPDLARSVKRATWN